MGRFDKNLIVTNNNISFFPAVREIIYSMPKGKERGYRRAGSTKGAQGRRKEDAPLLPSPPRAVSCLNSLPFSLEPWHAGSR